MADFAWGINADAGSPAYSAQSVRLVAGMWLYPGGDRTGAREGLRPASDATVFVSGGSWTVRPFQGSVYPGFTTTSGAYNLASTGDTGSLDPADATNPRIDALDAQVLDDDEDTSGSRLAQIVYTAGTPGASPSEPSAPADGGSFRLATISVPAGDETLATIDTPGQWTVSLGGILPVRGDSELPTTQRYAGMAVYRQDRDTIEVWDGSAWVIHSTANPPELVVFTSSDTFQIGDYPWARAVMVEVVGGGGAGGGTGATGSGETAAGSGGGAGGYSRSILDATTLSSSISITPGAAGAGASGASGGAGSDSSFGTSVIGLGGGGGTSMNGVSGFDKTRGALGGAQGTGQFVVAGGNGHSAMAYGSGGIHFPGEGGDSAFGRGGRPANTAGSGLQGGEYGGGGSGGSRGESGTATSGGPGNDGVVIVEIR